MTAQLEISDAAGPGLTLVFGLFFGLVPERGGLGNPHKLSGVFYLKDFTLPKVMFKAIIVASVGLYLLVDLHLLDMSRVWIVPTYFWPQLAGGALFGIGFVVSGYCPGTVVAGLATGRLDALVAMANRSRISSIRRSLSRSGKILLVFRYGGGDAAEASRREPVNHWMVLVSITMLAGGMYYLLERFEKKEVH